MNKYVLDHHALQYMLEQFPRTIIPDLWEAFQQFCQEGVVVSHRESQKCLDYCLIEEDSLIWVNAHSSIFKPSTTAEIEFLGVMMKKKELDFLNTRDLTLRRLPEDMPFLLCMAHAQDGYYVYRKNTRSETLSRIKKICDAYKIKYMEVEACLVSMKAVK